MQNDWLPWAYRKWWKPIASDPVRLARYQELRASDDFMVWLELSDEFGFKPRKWYKAIWWDCTRSILYKWHRSLFWLRFQVLHIKTKDGYWHLLHNGIALCPDCDYLEECPDTGDDHLCVAEIGKASDFKEPATCHYCQRPTTEN